MVSRGLRRGPGKACVSLGVVSCSDKRITGEGVLTVITGKGEACAALRPIAPGRLSSGLGLRVGGQRSVGGCLEFAVADVQRQNP